MCLAILALALGVAAEVPDWLQMKPQIPSTVNMRKLMQQRLSHGRRMQAIMSAECQEACPGVEDLIKTMTEGRRLDGHDGDMSKYCPHISAAKCMMENRKVCDDEPDKEPTQEDIDGMNYLECFCACPDIADTEDPKKMCPKKDAIVGCMTSTSACSKMVKEAGGARSADVTCEILDAGCEEKDIMPCVGEDKMMKWGPCDEAASKGDVMANDCCPTLKDIVGCYTQKCIDLFLARNKLMADGGNEELKEEVKKNIAMGSACPGSGMPASEAEMSSIAAGGSGAKSSDAGSAAADDAPAHALPVLALILGLVINIAFIF